jgi:excisionase family DNA binding protein
MERLAYSIKEAAEAIGVSPRTVVREIQRGHLRAIRVSRRVLVPARALAEFLGDTTSKIPVETIPAATT